MRSTTIAAEDGVATLEMALTLPLLLAAIWGVISFGLVFTVEHTLAAAASDGARAAVATATEPAATTAAATAAQDRLDSALGSFAPDAVVDAPVVGDCAAPAGARCITVTVRYPWATSPIIPDLFAVVTPDELRSTATVQLGG